MNERKSCKHDLHGPSVRLAKRDIEYLEHFPLMLIHSLRVERN